MYGSICGVTARYEHDGKHYCKTHHPPTVKAKRDARYAGYEQKFDERRSAENAAKIAADAQRKNDERYRWLRSRIPGSTYRIMGVIYSDGGAGVDAAIDVAMAAKESK